jgi:hypothetical protein
MRILLSFEDLERLIPEDSLLALKREALRRSCSLEQLVKEGMIEKARSINGTRGPKRNGHKKGAAA